MSGARDASPVRVYLCACGPIMAEAMDLDALAREIAELPGVEVARHETLCSEQGRAWLAEQVAGQGDARTVLAACSPREHQETFRRVFASAGLSTHLFSMAAIREQAAWVTPDRAAARAKALALVRGEVARVRLQEPLEARTLPANPAALVVGAGVAGMTAARLIADGGRNVTLVERDPAVGGRVARLSELYPGDACASCVLEPEMDAVLHHPNIEVLTGAEITEVLGFLGGFQVRVSRESARVDPELCYGCHTCHEACPVEVPREADLGLSARKAIFVPYVGAVPNVSFVDPAACLRDQGGACDACAAACPFGAIDLTAPPRVDSRDVGAVLLATGAEEAPLPAAWAESPRVVTAMTVERMLNESGPTSGRLEVGGKPPRSVAILHGADASGAHAAAEHDGLCCFLAGKLRHALTAALPEARLHEVAFSPERAVGSVSPASSHGSLRSYALGTQDEVLALEERVGRGALRLRIGGHETTLPVDLLVVIRPLRGMGAGVAALVGLEPDPEGFFVPDQTHLRPFYSRVDGVFVCGNAVGPAPVASAVASGAAAAGAALSALVPGRELNLSPEVAEVDPDRCGACHTCIVTCPYGAARHDPETGRAVVDPVLCRGCGACVAACPSAAIDGHHFTDAQLRAELEGLMGWSEVGIK